MAVAKGLRLRLDAREHGSLALDIAREPLLECIRVGIIVGRLRGTPGDGLVSLIAGGTRAFFSRLKSMLHLDAATVSGKTCVSRTRMPNDSAMARTRGFQRVTRLAWPMRSSSASDRTGHDEGRSASAGGWGAESVSLAPC